MKLPEFITATDERNNTAWWRWVSAESPIDPLIIAVLSTRDRIRAYVHRVRLSFHKMFARTTVSFMVYAVVFGAASATAAVLIAPLVILSFFFSGLVILFSSLSFSTFRVASSKYNRTVLFLNRLLRGLADNIPPSVGIIETVDIRKKTTAADAASFKKKYTPSVLVQAWNLMLALVPAKKDPAPPAQEESKTPAAASPDAFQLEMIGPGAPVVYDEDPQDPQADSQAAESASEGLFTPQENHAGDEHAG